jgi:hypothetical protein
MYVKSKQKVYLLLDPTDGGRVADKVVNILLSALFC